MAISRTAITDDDGTGTTGTVINNAWKTELYNQIDGIFTTAPLDISGASAGQIKFPATQNSSTNVNILDDYEEGTWTPVIGGSGGTSGQTYSSQVGLYRKIGSVVFAYFDVTLSAKGTITSVVQIQGLPFAGSGSGTTFTGFGGGLRWVSLATTWVNIWAAVNISATNANVSGTTAASVSSTTNLLTADIGNTSQFSGLIVYFSAT